VDALCNFFWSPSFTPYHNPGAIFNVDICGGLPALVTEMILQSSADEITLLPALAEQWPCGQVRGVRTRCGAIVDFSWKKGKPVAVVFRAERKTSFRLRYRDLIWNLKLEAGQKEEIGVNADQES
jgi:hypothetical protein